MCSQTNPNKSDLNDRCVNKLVLKSQSFAKIFEIKQLVYPKSFNLIICHIVTIVLIYFKDKSHFNYKFLKSSDLFCICTVLLLPVLLTVPDIVLIETIHTLPSG